VLIVDDHADMRALLRILFEEAGCEIVGEAPTADDGIAHAARLGPDVVVLDWEMPGMSGVDAVPHLRAAAPRARVVMFSSRPSSIAEADALAAGADAYLDKSRSSELVARVVELGAEASADERRARSARLRLVDEAPSFRVLVIDDDPVARRLIRIALELEGASVTEAATMHDADEALEPLLDGVILDRRLPDGDGHDLLPVIGHRAPSARVVVCSNVEDHREPAYVFHVPKTNMDGVVAALGLSAPARPPSVLDVATDDLVLHWQSRCRSVGVSTDPALIDAVFDDVFAALSEQETEPAAGAAPAATVTQAPGLTVEDALRQLHCLRAVLVADLNPRTPTRTALDALMRANSVIDGTISALVAREADRLRREAFIDALTGLPNRRAFDEALDAELTRANRYRHPFSVVVIDLDGLKQINDHQGHPAGDAAL
jgi:PleD family two-component response regulator